jgi:hypothetical protein
MTEGDIAVRNLEKEDDLKMKRDNSEISLIERFDFTWEEIEPTIEVKRVKTLEPFNWVAHSTPPHLPPPPSFFFFKPTRQTLRL